MKVCGSYREHNDEETAQKLIYDPATRPEIRTQV